MKHLVCILMLAWLCFACDNTNKTQETTSPILTPDTAVLSKPTILSRYSNRLQQIVSKEAGLVRGFTPGELLDSVMRRETAVLHEDSLRYKGYFLGDSLSTDVLDIRYFFNFKTRLTDSLVIDTYAESDSLMKELTAYFTVQFGNPALQKQKSVVWNVGNNQVVVRDVGVKLSPGLQVIAKKAAQK